jgi:hypothetical protein
LVDSMITDSPGPSSPQPRPCRIPTGPRISFKNLRDESRRSS